MDTTYVISLDALDLEVLPFTYQPRRITMPLWSYNRSADLCEFQIRTQNTTVNEQSVTEEITQVSKRKRKHKRNQTTDTTMCHMCKVDVPKRFLKEHRKSMKHNTYIQIANIALKRIKDHIQDVGDCDNTVNNSLTYFCSHCVAAVNTKGRKLHENSLSHKNAVFFDKYVADFLDVYSNFDKNDNDEKESTEMATATTSSNKNENEDNKFDLNDYLKTLKDKHKMPMKIIVINEEKLEIEIEGNKIEVATENFHGFKKANDEYIECIVCKAVVNINDKVEHIMTAKHMFRVSTPLKNIHCKREIYPLWHHCVICNLIIDNYSMHTESDPCHYRLLQEALKYKRPDNSTQNPKSSENPENNVTLIQSHNDGKAYNIMKMKLDGSSIVERFFYHYIMDVTDQSSFVNCSVCDIVVPKDEKLITVHLESVNHIKKYEKLITDHHLVLQDDNIYCNICNVFIGLKGEIIHVRGKRHLKNLQYSEGKPSTSTSFLVE